jgi:cytidylate kinase
MSDLRVITIDGSRGTGKSRLAADLRQRLGFEVLEVGPLFRLVAWKAYETKDYQFDHVTDALSGDIALGRIRVDLKNSGLLSANRILVGGGLIEEELWHHSLDMLVKRAAESGIIIEYVRRLSYEMVTSDDAIVVGRQVGSQFFPRALAKFFLRTNNSLRKERKVTQLSESNVLPNDYSVDMSEPKLNLNENLDDTIVVDTTDSSPPEVLRLVMDHIERRKTTPKRRATGGLL